MADNLHPDLLVPIVQRLISFDDFRSFGAVCKSWSSAATKENFTREHQFPWIMLPEKEGTSLREFYDLKRDKIFKLDLPQTKQKLCFSSLGWIMTLSSKNSEVSLLHPLTEQVIKLPDLKTFDDHHVHDFLVRKFMLSSSPSLTSDYTVLIMSPEKVAVWSPGDHDWTTLDEQEKRSDELATNYLDVTYYEGQFYVLDDDYSVSVCEFGHPEQAQTRVVVPRRPWPWVFDNLYLVESAGALLVVVRLLEVKTSFKVFQVPLTGGMWSVASEVKNLGNMALFLGYNSSFSLNALDHPCCKPNCIYFTHEPLWLFNIRMKGMGIFHMEDGKVEPVMENVTKKKSPCLWIEPSF